MTQLLSTKKVLARIDRLVGPSAVPATPPSPRVGDARDGSVYELSEGLAFAVKVALSAGRPLLLTGAPGSGKSSLAPYLAAALGWRYYEQVVTSRTEASDLLWRFDMVRKLSDASARQQRSRRLDDRDYVEPGVLWWAVDPADARHRGGSTRTAIEPNEQMNEGRSEAEAVVLIDEIDKADPDVPNALLVALGSFEFNVQETAHRVVLPAADARRVFVVVTSNGERDLPAAFVRRCVSYTVPAPDELGLVAIARLHSAVAGRTVTDALAGHLARLAKATVEEQKAAASPRRAPGTAEFLDAVRAAIELRLKDNDARWETLVDLAIVKREMRA